MWTHAQLLAAFRGAGLRPGDTALVHSSLRKLGPVAGGADTVLDALLDALAPDGTLVLPTHTWKVVNAAQPVFHQTLTPSNVGVLTNVFRRRPGVARSLHPTHSLAAIGPRAAELLAGHERDDTPCPANGPYGRLRDGGGKVLILGEDLACCTLFHGCEEWAGLPWAVSEKPIQLYSITAAGHVIPVALRHHCVRSWELYPRIEPDLLAAGVMRIHRLGECPLRILDAGPTAEWLVARLRADPGLLHPDSRA